MWGDSLLPQSPRGQVGREVRSQRGSKTEPQKVPRADLGRTEQRVSLHETTAAQPAGDKPDWGKWNKESQGQEARLRGGRVLGRQKGGMGSSGRVWRKIRAGEPGWGYLLGVCPPAVPPESG